MNSKNIFIYILIFIALAIFGYLYSTGKKTEVGSFIPIDQETITQEAATPTGRFAATSLQEDPNNSGGMIYISHRLGIQFSYQSVFSNPVEPSKIPPPLEHDNQIDFMGPAIFMFEKNSSDSLAQAVQKQFISEFDPEVCVIKTIDRNLIENAGIHYPGVSIEFKEGGQPPDSPLFEKCPKGFTQGGIGGGFFYDSKYPERFYYYSGDFAESAYAPDGKSQWFTTIRIIPTSDPRS